MHRKMNKGSDMAAVDITSICGKAMISRPASTENAGEVLWRQKSIPVRPRIKANKMMFSQRAASIRSGPSRLTAPSMIG